MALLVLATICLVRWRKKRKNVVERETKTDVNELYGTYDYSSQDYSTVQDDNCYYGE